jgi:hypothetical protein
MNECGGESDNKALPNNPPEFILYFLYFCANSSKIWLSVLE